jgi:hypothetical protein
MNILHMSRTFLAGVPVRLTNFLNKYAKDRIVAKGILDKSASTYFTDSVNIYWQGAGGITAYEKVYELMEWADIIHIHNFPSLQHEEGPGWEILRKKPVILQFHSEPKRCNTFYNNIVNYHKVKISRLLCIAQYQAVFIQRPKIIVRNVIDINNPLLQPIYKIHSKPLVTYSPTNTLSLEQWKKNSSGPWAYKSFAEVSALLQKYGDKNKQIDYRIITGTPYEQHLKIRQDANIHIDEVHSGSYHLSSLEGLAQGKIVIANIESWMKSLLVNFLHCLKIPWFITNPQDLDHDFKHLLTQEKIFLECQKQSREWMEEFWNPELVLNDYMRIYESL